MRNALAKNSIEDPGHLMTRVRERDCLTSFQRLYDATSPRVLGLIMRVNHDRLRAEDALEAAYVTAWARRSTFDPTKESVATWLSAIAYDHAVRSLHRWMPTTTVEVGP